MVSINNQGNIISPNGATFLYGSKITESNDNVSIVEQDQILLPYEILVVDEDDDETIPAESVSYEPFSNSELTGSTVASVINELENLKISKSGDTMTGALILSGSNPNNENEAVTKKYVNTEIANIKNEIELEIIGAMEDSY